MIMPRLFALTLFALLLAGCSTGGGYERSVASRGIAVDESDAAGAQMAPGSPTAAGDRLLIRNGSLYLTIAKDDLSPLLERARAIVKEQEGYVQAESRTSLTIRVPGAAFDTTMAALEKLGEVEDRQISLSDVTEAHADLNIRIENARKLKTRLHELLARASKVEDVLAIERELQRVTNELESMEAQLRDLNKRVAFATIQLQFNLREDEVRPGPLGWVLYGAYYAVRWLFIWD